MEHYMTYVNMVRRLVSAGMSDSKALQYVSSSYAVDLTILSTKYYGG